MNHHASRVAPALVLLLTVVAGCSSGGGQGAAPTPAPSTPVPSTAVSVSPVPPGTPAPVPSGSRTPLPGFKQITVTVIDADGTPRTFCLLLADTADLHAQGLMEVTDPRLGGYDGMLFAFPEDETGAFWMRNTLLPLSIAYLREDGSTVSTAEMEPCPITTLNCPQYEPGGAYRNAIEVPQAVGGLAHLGISDRSKVTLGPQSCPA